MSSQSGTDAKCASGSNRCSKSAGAEAGSHENLSEANGAGSRQILQPGAKEEQRQGSEAAVAIGHDQVSCTFHFGCVRERDPVVSGASGVKRQGQIVDGSGGFCDDSTK
jgi:hypothetical protein